MVLLFGGLSVCLADQYDRKLEQAMMDIVAGKMGDIRGPLDKEWKPSEADGHYQAERPAEPAKADKPVNSGSFVSIDPPAMSTATAQAAAAIVEKATHETPAPPILPEPRRNVRVISLYD